MFWNQFGSHHHRIAVRRSLAILSVTVVAATVWQGRLFASEYVFHFSGQVTSIDDAQGWFNGSLQVGQHVEGSNNLYDAGYKLVEFFDDGKFYQFAPNLQPGLPPGKMQMLIGGHTYKTNLTAGAASYSIGIFNDNDSGTFDPGDSYRVQSPLDFPGHFHNFTGDPTLDPRFLYDVLPTMGLRLIDPSGNAISTLDLPLTAPDLTKFASRLGTLTLTDANLNVVPYFARMQFRIDSLTAVPEPATLVLLILAGVGWSFCRDWIALKARHTH